MCRKRVQSTSNQVPQCLVMKGIALPACPSLTAWNIASGIKVHLELLLKIQTCSSSVTAVSLTWKSSRVKAFSDDLLQSWVLTAYERLHKRMLSSRFSFFIILSFHTFRLSGVGLQWIPGVWCLHIPTHKYQIFIFSFHFLTRLPHVTAANNQLNASCDHQRNRQMHQDPAGRSTCLLFCFHFCWPPGKSNYLGW